MSSERVLLVEGKKDKRIIPWLIERNGVEWGETAADAVVNIRDYGGFTELIRPGVIETELKASRLRYMGIIADADADASSCYGKIRSRCIDAFPELPEIPHKLGVVAENASGQKLGVWLMPDNHMPGMFESFLLRIADDGEHLLAFAEKVCDEAKALGAPFKNSHVDKARIHTWLAWQDEPGPQLHDAVKYEILKPKSPAATDFVRWFRKLYEL